MKFLNLETGYTFDGIWKNTIAYTDWTVEDRSLPVKCNDCGYISRPDDEELFNLQDSSNIQLIYSNSINAENPNVNLNDWNTEFDYETSCKYAYRTEIPQTKGYIHWFPNEQSTGIIYNTPICILTETNEPLNIKLEENKIFSFVSIGDETTEIDGYTFIEPEFSFNYITVPQKLDKYYAHVFHIACKSEIPGEYICKVTIDDEHYFRVGVDLYGEYEPSYINLSNFGVELPEMIQKAIYDVDPHEDVKDNIVINRKFKELLITYWDVIANKGSYKSLVNSLKWFEWNNIEVKELWKRKEANKSYFDDRQIMSIFENKINDIRKRFIKTTSIALYCSIYNELDEYDLEHNPIIVEASKQWSKEDLRLKMAFLAKFFGAHFMPINLILKHATAEDKVFTNSIKNINAYAASRNDAFNDFGFVESNIKDDQIFRLSNVRAQVTNDTIFGIKDNEIGTHFGVDVFPSNKNIDESNIKVFTSKYYTGPGVIIPIEFVLSNQEYNDFLTHTIVTYEDNKVLKRLDFYDVIYTKNGKITIKFNLLLKKAKSYSYTFTFINASGKTLTKNIKFVVLDPDRLHINTYKIISKDDSNGFTYEDFKDTTISKYIFNIQNNTSYGYYKQYLPVMEPTNQLFYEYKGIKLNRTIVIQINKTDGNAVEELRNQMKANYLEFTRYPKNDELNGNILKYLIYVSKHFYEDYPIDIIHKCEAYEVIRNSLGFYPQFHKLQLLNGNTIKDYTINQYDALCCIPITIHNNKEIRFKYGQKIEGFEWEFINKSTGEIIKHPISSQQPFIAKSDNNTLDTGYYGIKFRYKLSDDDSKYNELNINSAFRVVHI